MNLPIQKVLEITEELKRKYLVTQDKKWLRVVDLLPVIAGIISSVIALYWIYYFPDQIKIFSGTIKGIAWGYFLALIPILFLIYKESALNKIERFALTLFILFSTMALMLLMLVAMTKT